MNQSDIDALMNGGAQSPELAELGNGVAGGSEVPLAMLMDLTLPLSIELGRTRMTVQDILRLGRGFPFRQKAEPGAVVRRVADIFHARPFPGLDWFPAPA